MSTFNVNVTLERKVIKVMISEGRVTVVARIKVLDRDTVVQVYEVDVTDLLSQARLSEIAALETDAQTWLDNQPFSI